MSAISRATAKRLGVEPGISGKELEFQQNRKFGPGAMKPYPFSKAPAATPRFRVGPIPNAVRQRAARAS